MTASPGFSLTSEGPDWLAPPKNSSARDALRSIGGPNLARLPARLAVKAITPRDGRYDLVRHTYASIGAPELVIAASDADDVREAVRFAAEQGLPLAVRSGGHGPSTNDGGIVIDLGHLRDVRVLDASRCIVRVEAGARWGEVAQALDGRNLALTSGDYGDVGVGGIATGGGAGLLARRQGLTIDRIRAVDVVLADGSLVRADADQNADLFWAVRGAGGAFGAVTAFEFHADPIGDVTSAAFTYEAGNLAGLLTRWADVVAGSHRELTSFLYIDAPRDASGLVARATVVYASGDVDAGRAALAPFADLAPIIDQRASLVRYMTLLASSRSPHRAQAAGIATRGGLLDHVTAESASAMADLLTSGLASILQLRSVGGAVNDVAADATAYPHRTQNFSLVVATPRARRPQLEAAWNQGLASQLRGTYLNLETERDETVLRRAFPPATLARLHDLKHTYDPTSVFGHSLPLPKPHVADPAPA
jgi:FAD binding domain